MLVRPWGDKTVNLVTPWTILARDARIVNIFGTIMSSQQISAPNSYPSVAEDVYASLMLLGLDSKEPVKIVLNSPGGDIAAGFTIIQAMNHLKAKGIEVWTLDLCETMSMGGIILMMGTKGRRFALENTMILTHFGKRSVGGESEADFEEARDHIDRINQILYQLISENSDIPEYYLKKMELKVDEGMLKNPEKRLKLIKDFLSHQALMTPDQGLEAGMIDKVLRPGDPIIDQIFSNSEGK